jgi:maltooligosyltrehalose trehalohydrolase
VEVAALSAHLRRPLTLIAESDLNDPVMVTPREAGGYGLDAQWSDDFHHALHVALTGETHGYYADFEPLARWPRSASAASSTTARSRRSASATHGVPVDTATMPTWRLVVASQNHDQVGNRPSATGSPSRSTTTSSPAPRC